ncbi:hypothetical protein BGZ70_004853 [Mortierella alpina]|uniref:Uncharacterized protein n=1 Tax=Mortierella alpina TaxID=64518 RepID=A0A9P6LUT0_MORAP|nr:hypothetical protein BGZ70_004853 [Mortierella alpina]
MRISLPKLAPSPSAPSTAFSRTTVTAATNATTRADVLEPSSAASVTDMFGVSSPSTSSAPLNVMSAKSAPEVPTLASLGRSGTAHHVRAGSPAISMASSPFAFGGLGRSSLPSPVTPQSPLNESVPKPSVNEPNAEEQTAMRPSTSSAVEEARETTPFMSTSKPSATPTRPVIRAPSLRSPPVTKSASSSPSYTQLQFQFTERYTAPEIISLASPLTGSIVTPRQHHVAVPHGRMAPVVVGGSSYTASFQDPSSRGSSLSSSHMMRRSMDGSRPSTSQGCYGSHGHGSSFGSTPPGSESQMHFPYYPQSSLPSTPTLRAHAQHPLALDSNQYHSHSHHLHRPQQQQQHQRQYSESAAPTSYLSSSRASPSYRHESFGSVMVVSPGSFEAGVHGCDGGDGAANRNGQRDVKHLSFPLSVNDYTRHSAAMISRIPEQKEEQNRAESFMEGGDDGTGAAAAAAAVNAGVSAATNQGQESNPPSTLVLKDPVHVKMDSGKFVGQHGSHNNSTSTTSSSISVRSVTDHVMHGTAQDFDRSFLLEELNVDSGSVAEDRSRRGSALSLRNAKSLGSFHPLPEKGLAMTSWFGWGQHRASRQKRMMMGDFLSELAKVEDGDVLIGNGRDGVVSRQ